MTLSVAALNGPWVGSLPAVAVWGYLKVLFASCYHFEVLKSTSFGLKSRTWWRTEVEVYKHVSNALMSVTDKSYRVPIPTTITLQFHRAFTDAFNSQNPTKFPINIWSLSSAAQRTSDSSRQAITAWLRLLSYPRKSYPPWTESPYAIIDSDDDYSHATPQI